MNQKVVYADDTNYDAIAQLYLADDKPLLKHYERPYMLSKLPPLEGKTVLDVGCGTGFYSQYCLRQGSNKVISVDASATMIEHTNRICKQQNSSYVHDIGTHCDFLEDLSIDVVICSLVLHYIEDWVLPLKEFYRALRPNGYCLISTHHPINDFLHFNSDRYFEKRLIEDTWRKLAQQMKVQYFVRSLQDYLSPIISSKFNILSIEEPQPDPTLKEVDEDMFQELLTQPGFLFFLLQK